MSDQDRVARALAQLGRLAPAELAEELSLGLIASVGGFFWTGLRDLGQAGRQTAAVGDRIAELDRIQDSLKDV